MNCIENSYDRVCFVEGVLMGFSSCLGEEMGEHKSIEGGERLIGMALVNLLVKGIFSSVYTIDGWCV